MFYLDTPGRTQTSRRTERPRQPACYGFAIAQLGERVDDFEQVARVHACLLRQCKHHGRAVVEAAELPVRARDLAVGVGPDQVAPTERGTYRLQTVGPGQIGSTTRA